MRDSSNSSNDRLIDWIRKESQRRTMWAFMERMGSEGSKYNAGYLQALEDVLKVLKEGDTRDYDSEMGRDVWPA